MTESITESQDVSHSGAVSPEFDQFDQTDQNHLTSPHFQWGLFLAALLGLGSGGALTIWWPQGLLPLGIAAVSTGITGLVAVPLLRRLRAGQVIRTDGPQSHLKKAGTPTMGGIYFLPVGLGVALVFTQANPMVVAIAGLTGAFGLVGWLDDWQVIRQQSNKGLTPKQKFGLQLLVALSFCGWLSWSGIDGTIHLPLLGELQLNWAYWPLALFVLVGTNNAVNLTDGMDGLAAGVVSALLVGLGLIIAPTYPSLAILALAIAGSCLGFLWHNRHPAQVFMGDTGSLGLGGGVAGIALLSDSLWALALLGGVLILESLSVILQVSYFKYTKRKTGEGKRIFRMAPLHHHLELGGWSETQVVSVCYGLTLGLSLLGKWLGSLS
jgi:phospho-N-acetylmuramoyl-pentapeptide-transferase